MNIHALDKLAPKHRAHRTISHPEVSPLSGLIRFTGLVRKESIQVLRDPSALLIAFALPLVLLFMFAYAVSLDIDRIPFGVVQEVSGGPADELAAAYLATPYLQARISRDRRTFDTQLIAGDIRGYVVIPADFEERLYYRSSTDVLQIITDGSHPNTASFTSGFAQGVFNNWQQSRHSDVPQPSAAINLEARVWFNPEIESRRVLLPGAIAIVMTMIGTLLTALVVAREWERGTMEALMSTPANNLQIIVSKLLPYFVLGMLSTIVCTVLSVTVFELPFRGSITAYLLLSGVFLIPALGQGLLISTLAKNQFIAAQIALLSAFLPSFLLSGFLYEISSMPTPIQWLSTLVSARWYVEGLQSIFLADDTWPLLKQDILALLALGTVFISITIARSKRTLD